MMQTARQQVRAAFDLNVLHTGSRVSGRSLGSWASKAWKAGNHGMTVDIHDVVRTDQAIGAMHANAEVFPPAVEYAFRYLQASISC